jgi:hypothetical protein
MTIDMKYPKEVLATRNYLEKQLFQVAPLPLTEENFPYGFDIKISTTSMGSDKATNYIRITPEQMKKIEDVLLGR